MKAKANNDASGPKIRADSWAAKLTPPQQWKLYRKARQSDDWTEALGWAKEEFHLDINPSRSAFFNWMAAMRKLEGQRRLEEISTAAAEAVALGKKMPKDEVLFSTFKMLAVEAALTSNVKAAGTYMQIASTLQNLHYKKLDIERKEAERKEFDRAATIARDAGRRFFLLQTAAKYGMSVPEAIEHYKARNRVLDGYVKQMFEQPKDEPVKDAPLIPSENNSATHVNG